MSEILKSRLILNTSSVKRIKTLSRAAKQAIAQNALRTAENTCLLRQNQERTQKKVSGTFVLSCVRLMMSDNIAEARWAHQRVNTQSGPALPTQQPVEVREAIDEPAEDFPNSDDLVDFAMDYLDMYSIE